jgi:hypothetical protein
VFGDDEYTLTEEEMNMIIAADAKIDHDRTLNAFRHIAAEIVHYQEELRFDKRCVAAEQAILSHNLLTHKTLNKYKTAMSRVNGTEIQRSMSYNDSKCGK